MYIATDGGSALDGTRCYSTGLNYGSYGSVQVYDVEGSDNAVNSDNCYDLGSTGTGREYIFVTYQETVLNYLIRFIKAVYRHTRWLSLLT